MSNHNHTFHLVNYSPWPLTGSIGGLTITSGMVMWFHTLNMYMYYLGVMILLLTMYQWWRDIIRESTFQGNHTFKVMIGLKWGMVLFILSEVLFFVSFFWAFFHSSLSPTIELGMKWPPMNIMTFNPSQIPLLNTMVLLCSGISITWAHHSLMQSNYKQTNHSMIITILLGLYFSMLQMFEYIEASFTISDSVYGSCFFIMTGFHGIHVIIGTMFILITFIRQKNFQFSKTHHLGFEASAWYWHFVDVVWLFLYITVYWWSN